MVALIDLLLMALTPFAGPYRALAFRFGTFGGFRTGLLTWAGVALAYPEFALYGSWTFWVSYVALILCVYWKMMLQWAKPMWALGEYGRHCWAGRYEIALVTALGLAARGTAGTAAGGFIILGYACSEAQVRLLGVRRRFEAWSSRDTARVMAPLRTAASGGLVILTATSSGGKSLLRGGWGLPREKPQIVQTPADGKAGGGVVIYQRRGLGYRLGTFLLGHTILNAVTGVIGVNLFLIPVAVVLWFAGWRVEAPWAVKDQVNTLIARGKDALAESKVEAVARLEREKAVLAERLKKAGDKAQDKAGEVARKAFRGGMGW